MCHHPQLALLTCDLAAFAKPAWRLLILDTLRPNAGKNNGIEVAQMHVKGQEDEVEDEAMQPEEGERMDMDQESAHAERRSCHSWIEVGSGHSCWCWLVPQLCDKACARLMAKLVPPTRSLGISNGNNRAQKVDREASAEYRSRIAWT